MPQRRQLPAAPTPTFRATGPIFVDVHTIPPPRTPHAPTRLPSVQSSLSRLPATGSPTNETPAAHVAPVPPRTVANAPTNAQTAPVPADSTVAPYQELHEYHELPNHTPWIASDARLVPFDPTLFAPNPDYRDLAYDPCAEIDVYQGKTALPTQRPWVELGRGMYLTGAIPPSPEWLGATNLIAPHLLVYGDYRMGGAYIDAAGNELANVALRLNLEIDFKITDTERIHAFTGPLDQGNNFTRYEFDDGQLRFNNHLDQSFDSLYFEGDVGSIVGGLLNAETPFDMPIAAGLFPWQTQNGIWFNDFVLGTAVTIPARNSRLLDISNYDITLFAVCNDLDSPAFRIGDDVRAYGSAGFFEMLDGYIETGYAYLDNTTDPTLSYHNFSVAYTRRIWTLASTSLRVIVNAGQETANKTADGQLILWESSLISHKPSTFVPYFNAFVGFGRPQSVARAGGTGGVLNNTGIVFESDGLNGTPTLDATANDTYGGAVGLNWIADDFSHQLILEAGTVQTFGSDINRNANGNQYGVGARYQLPLNHAWILRLDALHGFLEGQDDLSAVRTELRWKF